MKSLQIALAITVSAALGLGAVGLHLRRIHSAQAALNECREPQDCEAACEQAYLVGLVDSLAECEH